MLFKLFNRHGALGQHGILGMNERNVGYISRYNARSLFPLVDNKLKTKHLALSQNVKVPDLIGVIESQHGVSSIVGLTQNKKGFCIKPAKGSGGKGILVIGRIDGARYFKTNGQQIPLQEIKRHISNVLAGLFSLGGQMDVAVIEELIEVDSAFTPFTHEGVPDLRVIVFQGFPVMAMMRLSCTESNGKANLHQGAVGVGIDIGTGRAIRAVQNGRAVRCHPDTHQPLADLCIPRWGEMLQLACACYDMTGLGYLGVDLVLDKNRGPLLLELNARPGLAIQIANNQGLLPRLDCVSKLDGACAYQMQERIAFARTHFAASATER